MHPFHIWLRMGYLSHLERVAGVIVFGGFAENFQRTASGLVSYFCPVQSRPPRGLKRGKDMAHGLLTQVVAEDCGSKACNGPSITSLDHEAFCVDHFLLRCYEKLGEVDPRGRKFSAEQTDIVSMRDFIEECSQRALEVSLHSASLSNLQRARLLDVLLWAGELYLFLREPRLTLAQSIASADSGVEMRAGSQRVWASLGAAD
jgi:hypothetical protein